jgi:hypothetical protein
MKSFDRSLYKVINTDEGMDTFFSEDHSLLKNAFVRFPISKEAPPNFLKLFFGKYISLFLIQVVSVSKLLLSLRDNYSIALCLCLNHFLFLLLGMLFSWKNCCNINDYLCFEFNKKSCFFLSSLYYYLNRGKICLL